MFRITGEFEQFNILTGFFFYEPSVPSLSPHTTVSLFFYLLKINVIQVCLSYYIGTHMCLSRHIGTSLIQTEFSIKYLIN